MAHHGLQVTIKQQGQAVKEFTNHHHKRHKGFDGYFRSRAVCLEPDKPIELTVSVTEDFIRSTETGVQIAIASEKAAQCFWIDYAHANIVGSHILSSFTTWDPTCDIAAKIHTPLPIPRMIAGGAARSAEWMVADHLYAREGYISVWIQRGRLNACRDELSVYRRTPTHPPKATKYNPAAQARVIREQWFDPLESQYGRAYVFEFCNANISPLSAKVPGVEDEFDPIFDVSRKLSGSKKAGLGKQKIRQSVQSGSNKILQTMIPQKRSAQDSDTGTRSKRICLPNERLSQNVFLSNANMTTCGATAGHTQTEDQRGEAGIKQREEKAESKSSPNFRVLTQRFEAAVNDAARAAQALSTKASEHRASQAAVIAPNQQSHTISCKIESDSGPGNYEDLHPGHPFQLGEIPLAETQTWKAYYHTMLIE